MRWVSVSGAPIFVPRAVRAIRGRARHHRAQEAESLIERLAFYDELTGLPNRRLLLERLGQALAACGAGARQGALLFIDLDNFKDLNDTLGHDRATSC
jgi:GGDEF domain-containing protein